MACRCHSNFTTQEHKRLDILRSNSALIQSSIDFVENHISFPNPGDTRATCTWGRKGWCLRVPACVQFLNNWLSINNVGKSKTGKRWKTWHDETAKTWRQGAVALTSAPATKAPTVQGKSCFTTRFGGSLAARFVPEALHSTRYCSYSGHVSA